MLHPLLPQAIFDRNRKDELPGLQLEWIDGICAPLYEVTQPFGLRFLLAQPSAMPAVNLSHQEVLFYVVKVTSCPFKA